MNTRFCLLLPLVLFAQDRPDARELLIRADEAIFTSKTVRLTATTFAGVVPLTGNTFKTEFVRGGPGRAELWVGNTMITLKVFDGTNLWEYNPSGHQYTKQAASAWPIFQGEIVTLEYGRNPNNIIDASYENDEPIDFGGRPVGCWVVRADYRGTPDFHMAEGVVRRVWISMRNKLILRDYWEVPIANRRVGVTTNYTVIETESPLPDDLFVFEPPLASNRVKRIVLTGVIGGVPVIPVPPPPPPLAK